MAKEEGVEAWGVVTEALPNATFKVQLDDMPEHIVTAHISGKNANTFYPNTCGGQGSDGAFTL